MLISSEPFATLTACRLLCRGRMSRLPREESSRFHFFWCLPGTVLALVPGVPVGGADRSPVPTNRFCPAVTGVGVRSSEFCRDRNRHRDRYFPVDFDSDSDPDPERDGHVPYSYIRISSEPWVATDQNVRRQAVRHPTPAAILRRPGPPKHSSPAWQSATIGVLWAAG